MIEKWLFACFLLVAAGQDLRRKQVDVWVYLLFGGLAAAEAGWQYWMQQAAYGWANDLGGVLLGLGMLGISMVSRGSVGVGDGCFFLVSGLLLGFWENLMLLCYGMLFCGLYCLGYYGWCQIHCNRNVKNVKIPFLPFAVLPGVWLILREMGAAG